VPVADTYYLWLQQSFPAGGGRGGPAAVSLTIDGTSQSLSSPTVPVSTYPAGLIPANGANTGIPSALVREHTRL
jgi:hypothetical protein